MPAPLVFAAPTDAPIPLHVIPMEGGREALPEAARVWLERVGFTGALGQAHLVPTPEGEVAVAGYGTAATRARTRYPLAGAAETLPRGVYRLATALPEAERDLAGLGWLLAGYAFDRYKEVRRPEAQLLAPEGCDAAWLETLAAGEALLRDLVNTPAADMGPAELEAAARALAEEMGAEIAVTEGAALEDGFPMIHAVGRAAEAARAPRLIDLRAGTEGPRVTLVGKGVCFDTGGLDLKPAASMALMKKDMGGAAHVLGLARILLGHGAKLRLRVLIPAVENAVSGASFRPGDVLTSRSGKTVEINNTDAEGRLVLADALTLAGEEAPDLLVSMATLTGAARVAVGPDIAPFFTGDEALAEGLSAAAARVDDPVWRLPFHAPYEAMIEPAIADLDNAPKGGFAGAITAALFLRRFAADAASYTHFDVYAWQPTAAPGRPVGGVGQGIRALAEAIPARLGL